MSLDNRSAQSTFRFGKIQNSATHCLVAKIDDFGDKNKKISSACVVVQRVFLGRIDPPPPHPHPRRLRKKTSPKHTGWGLGSVELWN